MRWLVLLALCLLCAGLIANEANRPRPAVPHNMPTMDEVRQIMLDCERYNPGEQCIFAALAVPNFGKKVINNGQ